MKTGGDSVKCAVRRTDTYPLFLHILPFHIIRAFEFILILENKICNSTTKNVYFGLSRIAAFGPPSSATPLCADRKVLMQI